MTTITQRYLDVIPVYVGAEPVLSEVEGCPHLPGSYLPSTPASEIRRALLGRPDEDRLGLRELVIALGIMPAIAPNPIILYDGVCALCNRLVRFVLKRDRCDQFRFAALQSDFAKRILERHNLVPQRMETGFLVLNHQQPGERLLARLDTSIYVMRELGGGWTVMATFLQLLPRRIRDLLYRLIARSRYRVFGKFQSCPVPDPQVRAKFLDADGG